MGTMETEIIKIDKSNIKEVNKDGDKVDIKLLTSIPIKSGRTYCFDLSAAKIIINGVSLGAFNYELNGKQTIRKINGIH